MAGFEKVRLSTLLYAGRRRSGSEVVGETSGVRRGENVRYKRKRVKLWL